MRNTLRQTLLPSCASPDCKKIGLSRKLLWSGVALGPDRYCCPDCLEDGLAKQFRSLLNQPFNVVPRKQHRVPIGLELVSRGEITVETLRAALEQQRLQPNTRLGQILIQSGAITEDQVTSAVASQWSLPVFRLNPSRVPEAAQLVPFFFLERYRMMPVHYVKQTKHLHLAFAQSVDRTAMYAIEQALGVTTEAGLANESMLTHLIEMAGQQERPAEYVLNRVPEAELPGIATGYAQRLHAETIELTRCNEQIWMRTTASQDRITHFLFSLQQTSEVAGNSRI